MKKNLLFFFGGIAITCLFAFTETFKTVEVSKSTAQVESIQGLMVFIHSQPVSTYKYLGTFSPKLVPSKNADK